MFRQRSFRTFKAPRICECSHPAIAHYLRGDARQGCRLQCPCPKYKEVKRPPKYHNKKTEFQGNRYDSKFEAKVAADLEHQRMCGEIKEIARQVKFPIIVNGKKLPFYYLADFVITHLDDTKEIVEAKGFRTDTFKLKWALVEVLYPDYKMRMETQR